MIPAQAVPTKARSRLSVTTPSKVVESVGLKNKFEESKQLFKLFGLLQHFFSRRLKYIPVAILAMIAYTASFYILSSISPTEIADIFFFHSYLPLQISVTLGNFFFFSFLFLHTRRAFLSAFLIALLFFLRLQSVSLTPIVIFILVFFVVILESLFSFIFKK